MRENLLGINAEKRYRGELRYAAVSHDRVLRSDPRNSQRSRLRSATPGTAA